MKKFLVLFVFLLLFLVGCDNKNSEELNGSDIKLLGVEAIASLNAAVDFKNVRTIESDEAIGKLKQADILLEEEVIFNKEESDRDEYLSKYVITFQNEIYYLYISNMNSENEDNETEVEFNGVLVHGEYEYLYEAEYEVETEENESEKELSLLLYYTETKTVKIKREFEVENNELEESFKYTLTENGQVISSYEVEREIEENVKTLEIVINNLKYKYSFYNDNDNEYVDVTIGESKFKYVITETDGEKYYSLFVE